MGEADKLVHYNRIDCGFASRAHFKQWYKKDVLRLLDFCLRNRLSGWNILADHLKLNWVEMKIWKIIAKEEEIINYTDTSVDENDNVPYNDEMIMDTNH